MPDRRKHRGPHPQDAELFGPDAVPRLRTAVHELSWLLGHRYAVDAALTLVGDHHQLTRRQRKVLGRAACDPAAAARRRERTRPIEGARVAVDGFNCIVCIEAALSGGLLYRGADHRLRDLASVHGTYRKVEETERAIALLAEALEPAAEVQVWLDRPVSNSGRVAGLLREAGLPAELHDQVDGRLVELSQEGWCVATADGPLLDRCRASVDVVGAVVNGLPEAWVVDLGTP